jgi:hypothetical protein
LLKSVLSLLIARWCHCWLAGGRSPQTTGVYNFIDNFREEGYGADWIAMPQFFKQHGWYTAGGGKVYHPGHPPNNDMPYSWDVYFKANGDDAGCRDNETLGWCCGLAGSNVCPSDEPDSAFYDWVLANDTVAQLTQHAQRRSDGDTHGAAGQPFFIAAGLRRPHRVWHVPRRFYDLYENNGTHPTNMPLALHKTGPVCKIACLVEFLLCLSRACLGNRRVSSGKLNSKRAVFRRWECQSSRLSTTLGPISSTYSAKHTHRNRGRFNAIWSLVWQIPMRDIFFPLMICRRSRYNQSVPIDDWRAELGRWGYYASVSFTDSNVGMMLDALDRLELAEETVVLFTGDHVRGWSTSMCFG